LLNAVSFSNDHLDQNQDIDDVNSLEGHGGYSDQEEYPPTRSDRPNSRLGLRQQEESPAASIQPTLRRPQNKATKQMNRHSMYDDYRFLDEHSKLPSSPSKSKQQNRPFSTKEFPNPSINRIGSGSGNQSSSSRLKSGSKSSSSESIPTLDLTVAGQKVFRNRHQSDGHAGISLSGTTAIRPPSGRLKPISSAKSNSSLTDDLSSLSNRTLEDVTNNSKSLSSLPPKTHLYKKKLAPLQNNNEVLSKKIALRSSVEIPPPYAADEVLSDRSEESNSAHSFTVENGREYRSSTGSDKRSRYH
jgi:hypothetical protein